MHKNTPLPFLRLNSKIVHCIGIGGIGLSALAQWFLAQKWTVSGSDISPNETAQSLGKLGIKVKFGHKKANIPQECGLVIYTQAIRPENIELREARQRNIPVLSYPEAIGRLTELYTTVAVAGAHGKSTTTALVSLILVKAGLDPTVIIGTKLKEFGGPPGTGNFRNGSAGLAAGGKKSYLVLETDEYGGAFLNYSPFCAIVTNIDREHLDFYKNLKNVKNSFLKFISSVRIGGVLILNGDDKNTLSLKPNIEKIASKNNLRIHWYSVKSKKDAQKIKKIIRISGEHNVSNTLAALTLARTLKIPDIKSLKAVGGYRGSWRRMEYRGSCLISHVSCLVYDDYAHHPTEIQATLQAFRGKFPKRNIICVFQPHQAERLKFLFKNFQSAFTDADITLILPIYRVAGRDAINPDFTSERLVKSIQKKYPGKFVFYLKNPKNLKKALKVLIRNSRHSHNTFVDSHYVLVMMGAGDIVNYTDSLIKN